MRLRPQIDGTGSVNNVHRRMTILARPSRFGVIQSMLITSASLSFGELGIGCRSRRD
jgi:hypothetical protein